MAQKSRKTTNLNTNFYIQFIPYLLFVVSALLYINTIRHGYVLDDIAVITQNNIVKKGISGIPEILSTHYWQGYWNLNAGLFRPLPLIFFALEWQFFPNNPIPSHLINIILYALCVVLLYIFLKKITNSHHWIFPVFASLLYAAQPAHTEVVANIKSRDEILCLLFFLLSAIQFIKGLKNNTSLNFFYSTIFLFLSLLSKEGALLFIPVLFLISFYFYRIEFKALIKKLIPHIGITILWFIWHELVVRNAPTKKIVYSYLDNSLVAAPDILTRIGTGITVLGRYIIKSFYPYELSYDYSFNQIPLKHIGSLPVVVTIMFCLATIYVAYRLYKVNPIISFSIIYFFITISLTCNVFMLIGTTMGDRMIFIPSIGTSIILAWLILRISLKNGTLQNRVSYFSYFIFILIFVFFSYKTIIRNNDWKSDWYLFKKDVNTATNSSRTHHNYGTVLMNLFALNEADITKKNQLLDEVIKHLEIAVNIDTNAHNSYVNLGVAYYKRKVYSKSIEATKRAIKLNPNDGSLYNNLGDAYYMNHQYDSCIVYQNKAIEKNSIHKDTYNFIGSSYFMLQNYEKSVEVYKIAINNDSLYADVWLNYGSALAMNHQPVEAINAYTKAYSLNPQNPQPLYFIAITYQKINQLQKATEFLTLYNNAIKTNIKH